MTPGEIETIFRDESGRALATLIRLVGDFDLAEDVLQEAFAVALERWPASEVPGNPRAWLVNVARNKAIDRIRRQIAFRGKQDELTHAIVRRTRSIALLRPTLTSHARGLAGTASSRQRSSAAANAS